MKHFLLSAITILGLSATALAFSGGSGTATDPYLVRSHDDLDNIEQLLNKGAAQGKYFSLTQDITEPYTRIIGMEYAFNGVFDGNGHSINVDINAPTENYVGLFSCVINGEVRNLTVTGRVVGSTNVAGIVGNPSNGSVLENLINSAEVIGTSYSIMAMVGGVAGGVVCIKNLGSVGCNISNCVNVGHVVGYGNCVGGVIGYSGQQVGNTLTNLANYGYVEALGSSCERYGGAIGNPLWDDKVHNVVSFGQINVMEIGGCLGNANPEDIGEIFYDKQMAPSMIDMPSQARMTSQIIGNGLSDALDADNWCFSDVLYPRPKMNGAENSSLMTLFATPVIFNEENNLFNINKDFFVGYKDGVKWSSENGCVFFGENGYASPIKKGRDTLIATLDGFTREIPVIITGVSDSVELIPVDKTSSKSAIYDLSGRRIDKPNLGSIYIQNGAKYIAR